MGTAHPTRAEKVVALKNAKRKLYTSGFVCCALHDASYRNPEIKPASKALRRYIADQLHGVSTLEDWLKMNRPDLARTCTAMRRYRRQWIDWMIASLEGRELQPPTT